MGKEIKVRKHADENDSFVELWKVLDHVKGEPEYYGRYTYGFEGTWYYVADPLGYCELDHPVKDDVVFICCDENGNECVRYSNVDKNPLPTFKAFMQEKWKEFCSNIESNQTDMTKEFFALCYNGESTRKLNQWLLTFKDPGLYKKEIDDMFGYDINWTSCNCSTEIAWEAVPNTEFEYLSHKYQFTKVTNKHDICGAEWFEYVCTDAPFVVEERIGTNKTWIKQYYGCLGDWFDKSVTGKMIDVRTAKELVIAELLKIYPKEKKYSSLLYVNGNYCYEKSYLDVAEALLGKNLYKDEVLKLVKELKERTENIVFIRSQENKEKIKQMYPDIYGYNWCLI